MAVKDLLVVEGGNGVDSSLLSSAQFLLMYLTMVAGAGWVSSNNKVGTHSCQRLVGGGGGRAGVDSPLLPSI